MSQIFLMYLVKESFFTDNCKDVFRKDTENVSLIDQSDKLYMFTDSMKIYLYQEQSKVYFIGYW